MKYTTNLFPKKEETTIDKITYFALHYLRYILVITQFVTICVFFYRFKADQEIVDLKDTLIQKKAIVDSTQSLIDSVKELDFKIDNVKALQAKQDSMISIYSYVFQNLPQDVFINSMMFEETGISLEGRTQNYEAVQGMFDKLKEDNRFETVTLDGINRTEEGFNFRMQLASYTETNGSQQN